MGGSNVSSAFKSIIMVYASVPCCVANPCVVLYTKLGYLFQLSSFWIDPVLSVCRGSSLWLLYTEKWNYYCFILSTLLHFSATRSHPWDKALKEKAITIMTMENWFLCEVWHSCTIQSTFVLSLKFAGSCFFVFHRKILDVISGKDEFWGLIPKEYTIPKLEPLFTLFLNVKY